MAEQTTTPAESNFEGTDVVEIINNFKANYTPNEEYNQLLETATRLKNENARLVEAALTNSAAKDRAATESNVERLEALSKEYHDKCKSGNMLTLATILCEQQDIRKELGLPSMFYPTDPREQMTESAKADYDMLDQVLHDCVKYANGNPDLFIQKWGNSII